MPIYEYRCKKCSRIFELRRPYSEAGEGAICPACGGGCEKLVSGFGSQTGHYLRAPKEPFRGAEAGHTGDAG
jgi:putative FmdB family regulatory protein